MAASAETACRIKADSLPSESRYRRKKNPVPLQKKCVPSRSRPYHRGVNLADNGRTNPLKAVWAAFCGSCFLRISIPVT